MKITLKDNTIRCKKTCNNWFGSKKCSMTLRQAITGKHECQKVTATYFLALMLTCYCLTKGSAAFFDLKQLLQVFLHLMVFIFQSDFSTILQNASLWCCIVIWVMFIKSGLCRSLKYLYLWIFSIFISDFSRMFLLCIVKFSESLMIFRTFSHYEQKPVSVLKEIYVFLNVDFFLMKLI